MKDVVELFKRVRQIEIVAQRTVDELFAGQYRSVFRGRGMEFSEVREYEPGDDIRSIDWNVTARAGHPFIKRYTEERELTVLFLVDTSASGIFGRERSKIETAVELAATLMFSAMKNNDKVGLITFGSAVERYFRPRKGRSNVLFLIRELLECEPTANDTDLAGALEYLNRVQKRRAVVFLLSDFLVPDLDGLPRAVRAAAPNTAGGVPRTGKPLFREPAQLGEYQPLTFRRKPVRRFQEPTPTLKALAVAGRRHDLVALELIDARETDIPDVGLLNLRDAETGEILQLDSSHRAVREAVARQMQSNRERIAEAFQRARTDHIPIDTQCDYVRELRAFFRRRRRQT